MTTTYLRPRFLRAFQVPRYAEWPAEPPSWIDEAIITRRLRRVETPHPSVDQWTLDIPCGFAVVYPGDWLVECGPGDLRRVYEKELAQFYEVVSPTTPPEGPGLSCALGGNEHTWGARIVVGSRVARAEESLDWTVTVQTRRICRSCGWSTYDQTVERSRVRVEAPAMGQVLP